MHVYRGVIAIMVAILGGCGSDAPEVAAVPKLVNAMRIADATGLMERAFPGRAKAAQEVNRSFRVSGPLIAFSVKVGDKISKGDLLARIDPQDYETTLRTVQGQYGREAANAKRAQADLSRLESIYKKDSGATSQAAIDRASQLRDSSRAGLRSLEASVKKAKDQLSYTYLKAPFDGVIAETYVENFETVVAKQPILRLLDATSIEFAISVPENLIGYAPYVESVSVTFDALPGVTVIGHVAEIGNEASQATRTYPVTLGMEQPEGAEILPGMAGAATIVSRPPADTGTVGIEIPATAVFTGTDMSKNYVWVIDETDKTLERREVIVGPLGRFGVTVTDGLTAGEWIAVKGVHSLKQAETVRIIDITQEST